MEKYDDDKGLNTSPSFGELCFSIIPLILKNNKSFLILDTGSTVTIIKNKSLLSNIYSILHDDELTVFCNSGTQKNTYHGNYPGIGEVWHNANSLANIVSFSLLANLFTVEYDQANQQFKCYISNNKTIYFKRKGGL